MGRYQFLEDVAVADCAVQIEADSVGDLFETAAAALAELMVDPATVDRTVERAIALDAPALDLLFYDWLSELIFLKDRDRLAFTETRVTVSGTGPFHLEARARGGVIDRARTALGADPKAVTFHQFAVGPDGPGWKARVVIDI